MDLDLVAYIEYVHVLLKLKKGKVAKDKHKNLQPVGLESAHGGETLTKYRERLSRFGPYNQEGCAIGRCESGILFISTNVA